MVNDVIDEHRSQQIPLRRGDEYAVSTAKRPVLVQHAVLRLCKRGAQLFRAFIEQGNQLVGRVEVRKWRAFHEIEAVGFEDRGSTRGNVCDMCGQLADGSGFSMWLPVALSGRKTLEYATCRCKLAIKVDEEEREEWCGCSGSGGGHVSKGKGWTRLNESLETLLEIVK